MEVNVHFHIVLKNLLLQFYNNNICGIKYAQIEISNYKLNLQTKRLAHL